MRTDAVRRGLRSLLPLHLTIALLLAPGYGAVLADAPDDGCVPPLHARIVQIGAAQIVAPSMQVRLEAPRPVATTELPVPGARPLAKLASSRWARGPPGRPLVRVDAAA